MCWSEIRLNTLQVFVSLSFEWLFKWTMHERKRFKYHIVYTDVLWIWITYTYSIRHLRTTDFWEIFSWQLYFWVFARNRRRNMCFHISFRCLAWDTNMGFKSIKPTHYLLDYGDFIYLYFFWPKTHAQASMCELVRCHCAKFMIGFSTILCVSDAIGA